jgi:hypothetical protein
VALGGLGALTTPATAQAAPSYLPEGFAILLDSGTDHAEVGRQVQVNYVLHDNWTIQWLRDGVAIPGATTTPYLIVPADAEHNLSFRVTAQDPGSEPATATSPALPVSLGTITTTVKPVTGTPKVGGELKLAAEKPINTSAPAALIESGTLTCAMTWLKDGEPIPGSENVSNHYVRSSEYGHQISFRVTCSAPGYKTATAETDRQTIAIGEMSLTVTIPATFGVGSSITGGYTVSALYLDGGAAATYSFQWLRDGAAIAGATAQKYTVVQADEGKKVSLRFTVSAPGYTTATVTSSEVTVGGLIGTPVVHGTARTHHWLTADVWTWTETGVTATYQWLRDGSAIAGATDTKYLVQPADVGKAITYRVVVSKAGAVLADKTAATVTPVKGVLNFNGKVGASDKDTATVGDTLTASSVKLTPSTDPDVPTPTLTNHWQWLRNGVAITGATAQTYKVVEADKDKALSVRITVTADGYEDLVLTSDPVGVNAPVVYVANLKIEPATADGTFDVGQHIVASYGATADADYSYQWLRDGQAITGANGPSYLIKQDDAGHKLSLRVTGTKAGYTSTTATSDEVSVLVGDAPDFLTILRQVMDRIRVLIAQLLSIFSNW